MNEKKRRVLAALLSHSTREEAAKAGGVSSATLRRYLRDPTFRAIYQEAVDGLVEQASTGAAAGLSVALSCLRDIVDNTKSTDTSKIAAANGLLRFGLQLVETENLRKRIEELEKAVEKTR